MTAKKITTLAALAILAGCDKRIIGGIPPHPPGGAA